MNAKHMKPHTKKPNIKLSMGKKQLSGLETISQKIGSIYSNQQSHTQITAPRKHWEGGPDPLDLVSILHHAAGPHTPEHWHYVSYGLSDLHGDGRVTEFESAEGEEWSGFGLELTFRLRKQPREKQAPKWPVQLLNSLARYTYKTGSALKSGDHVPWHQSLDGTESLIRHVLVTDDQELGQVQSTAGAFTFRQLVGLTDEELRLVQRWNGKALISEMSKVSQMGGPLLITDMTRTQSLTNPSTPLPERILRAGSNLGHVMGVCSWEEIHAPRHRNPRDSIWDLSAVTLNFDLEAASLLPIAMSQRLQKGHYFIYQNLLGQVIVFIPYSFQADMVTVDEDQPIRCQGEALQIFCSASLISAMATDLSVLEKTNYLQDKLPVMFEIETPRVTIQVLPAAEIKHME